jgi:hypothetical protein
METNLKSDEPLFKLFLLNLEKQKVLNAEITSVMLLHSLEKFFVWYLTAFGRRDVPYIERTPLALKNIVSFQSNKVS